MRLVCDKCSAVYTIEDGLVGGRDFRVSCKECGTPIVVRSAQQVPSEPPRSAHSEAPSIQIPPRAPLLARSSGFSPSGTERWFIFVGGKQDGPYAAAQLAQFIEQGRIDWTTQVWRDGLKDWRAARRDSLLVTAVAGARGVANDTMRLNSARSFLAPEDTIVEARPDLLAGRPDMFFGEAVQPVSASTSGKQSGQAGLASGNELLSSNSETQTMDMRALTAADKALPDLTPSARPQAWNSPENAAFRAGLGLPQDSALLAPRAPSPVPAPTFAESFRSAPSLMRGPVLDPTAEPIGSLPDLRESWVPRPQSMLAVAAVAFAAGVLAAALWGRFVGKSPPPVRPKTVVQSAPLAPAAPSVRPERPVVRPATESAEVLRELPDPDELRGEVRRVAADVKRCVDDPEQGVDVDIYLDGPSGRVRDVDVRSPQLTPGRVECIAHAVRRMQLKPFARPELKLMHKFSW